MKLSQRRGLILGAIAVGVVILMTLFAAPVHNKLNSGSIYGRAPDGYGAWYAFMSAKGTPVQRWQKPFKTLTLNQAINSPITLIQIYSQLRPDFLVESPLEREWIEKGNTLVILGILQPVTEASFSSWQASPVGNVKIDTSRRKSDATGKLLGDRFGAIVWQQKIGNGQVILATTPYLAANAYQDFPSNYEFLAQLVTQPQNPVWIDEYIHGYKDGEVIEQEIGKTLWHYLAKTPLVPVSIQGAILLLVAIWANNHRLGEATDLLTPGINNSTAYIQALASVLQKAESSEFVVSAIAQEEQRQLQKTLGLGQELLPPQSLIDAWIQQTGQPATALESLLKTPSHQRPMSEADLLTWLEKWQTIGQVRNKEITNP
jgi:hypothetical protein